MYIESFSSFNLWLQALIEKVSQILREMKSSGRAKFTKSESHLISQIFDECIWQFMRDELCSLGITEDGWIKNIQYWDTLRYNLGLASNLQAVLLGANTTNDALVSMGFHMSQNDNESHNLLIFSAAGIAQLSPWVKITEDIISFKELSEVTGVLQVFQVISAIELIKVNGHNGQVLITQEEDYRCRPNLSSDNLEFINSGGCMAD